MSDTLDARSLGGAVLSGGEVRRGWRLDPFRDGQAARPAGLAGAFAAAYVSLALAGYAWTTATGGLAVLWLCNGVLAAALLLLSRRAGLTVAVVALITDFLASRFLGSNDILPSVIIASIDVTEAFLAASLARRFCGGALDVTRLRRLTRLVLLAILPATAAAGTVGALTLHQIVGTPLLDQWVAWAIGDFLGMSIALPACLLLARPARFGTVVGSRLPRFALIAAIGLGTAAIFVQQEVNTLILLVVMGVVLAPFVLSPACVATTIVIVAFVSASLTISGYGPIALDQPSDMGRRILVLQMFLMIVTVSGLTATALVADRDRSRRSLARTLDAARLARSKADAAAAAKTRFLAVMSHEMRTPLNGMMGHAEALERLPRLPGQARESIQKIRTSAEALACLVDDILDASQLDASQLRLDPAPTDVADVIMEAAAMGRTLVAEKPIAIEADLPDASQAMHLVDSRRLAQVLLRLVANAVKFTDAGQVRIDMTVTPGDGEADLFRIAVSDTGVGVPPDAAERLFAPFQQADSSTTRRHDGAGLSLAISRDLMALMGGRIGYEPRAGGGSSFWIEFPAIRASFEAETAAPADERPPRVLVVDDHLVNQEVAKVYLEAYGCEIVCCKDGAEAVRAVEDADFDLVFMDIHMPVMDGIEATRAIRSLPSPHAQTPIVALTAAATAADVEACLEAGMNAHLSKPIRGDRLAEALMRYGRWSEAA
ncbi:response regulator [Phenylobacterium kunshanense]|uniref:response regulator n=1 Tax=Phenylobacterium kunshanense TaxID=1445034 RepID=UPI0014033054|nr:response regulator [Phenylobacterium kunshanense]